MFTDNVSLYYHAYQGPYQNAVRWNSELSEEATEFTCQVLHDPEVDHLSFHLDDRSTLNI